MRKKILLAIIVFLLAAVPAVAAPYLVCDPQSGVAQYRITWDGQTPEIVPAQPDGSIRYDLVNKSGSFTGTIEAGQEWILDGTPQGVMEWSDPLAFSLDGGKPATPLNLKLSGE